MDFVSVEIVNKTTEKILVEMFNFRSKLRLIISMLLHTLTRLVCCLWAVKK